MSNSRRVITFINIAHAIDHMFMLIFPTAVLGMTGDFGMSYGDLLTLSLGGFIAFGAGSIPAGWLGDHWSRRKMMTVFFIGIGAATVLTSFANTPLTLAAGLTLMGLFASIYHPVGTAMLTAHAEKQGSQIGINGLWGNLGIAFAAVVTGAITQFLNWRLAFVIPGICGVVVGIVYALTVTHDTPNVKKVKAANVDLPRATVIRAFAVLAAVTVFGGIVFSATTVAMPKVFDERLISFGATPFGIGVFVFCVYVLGAISQIIVGRLVDRYTLRNVFVPLSLMQAPCLLLAAYAYDWMILIAAVGMMFAIFGQVTINDTMVAKYTSVAWRGRAYAIRYLMSFTASACAVPLIANLHQRSGNFGLTFQVLAVLGALVFVGALFFPNGKQEHVSMPARQPAS
jgi:MFS family permease